MPTGSARLFESHQPDPIDHCTYWALPSRYHRRSKRRGCDSVLDGESALEGCSDNLFCVKQYCKYKILIKYRLRALFYLTEGGLLVFLFLSSQMRLLSRQMRGNLLFTLLLSKFTLTLQRICKMAVERTVPDLFALMYPLRFVLKLEMVSFSQQIASNPITMMSKRSEDISSNDDFNDKWKTI